MQYPHIESAIFVSRPNRFIATVEVAGETLNVHVKNTGRLKELLILHINSARICTYHRKVCQTMYYRQCVANTRLPTSSKCSKKFIIELQIFQLARI